MAATDRRWGRAVGGVAALLLSLTAFAQGSGNPRGNPQGSETPGTSGRAAPAPASRPPQTAAPTPDGAGRRTNPDQPDVSSGHGRQPGAGQPGGLGGQRAAGSGNRTTETDQAPKPGTRQGR